MQKTVSGFFDLQANGFGGVDFNLPGLDAQAIARAETSMRATGAVKYLPTIITSSFEHFAACAKPWATAKSTMAVGLHMEGPYISPEDGPRGAHDRTHVCPASVEDFKRRQDAAGGMIRLVTVAPEIPGALKVIEYMVAQGVRVAIGHSAAKSRDIHDAAAAGATLSTHLGNGSARMLDKYDNLITAQLAHDGLSATLIVDGHHLPEDCVRVFTRAKTPARCILVTDATAAAGCPPGRYSLGDEEVERDESGRVFKPQTGALAGSGLSLHEAVANTVRFAEISIEEAWAMASTNPARAMGEHTLPTIDVDWNEESKTLRVLFGAPKGA